MSAENIRKVKVIVLGDSGVGKTSLVHLICHAEVLTNPSSTVGCNVEVKLHEYSRSVSSTPTSFFVEFWDVGGALSHERGRPIFYQQANGIILVHDLTNRKSHSSLNNWLRGYHQGSRGKHSSDHDMKSVEYDPEQFADQELPILIVGTKEDQVSGGRLAQSPSRGSNMVGAVSINVNSTDSRQFALDSSQLVDLNNFIDKVIEQKFYPSLRPVHSSHRRSTVSKRHSLNSQYASMS